MDIRITEQQIKKSYVDYTEYQNVRNIVHFGPEYISESMDFQEESKKISDKLKHIYHFKNWQIEKDEHSIIKLTIADIKNNIEIIRKFMSQCGYMLYTQNHITGMNDFIKIEFIKNKRDVL